MGAYEEAIYELKKLSCRDCIHQDSFCTYEPHGVIYCPYAIEKKDYVLSLSVGPYTLKELIELASKVKEGQRLAIVEEEGEPKYIPELTVRYKRLLEEDYAVVSEALALTDEEDAFHRLHEGTIRATQEEMKQNLLAAGFVKEVKK